MRPFPLSGNCLYMVWCSQRNLESWWRHQMETFSALLAICAGNSPVPGEFPTQRPVTRSFDVNFDLSPNKRLSKQLWIWWFETQSCPLWRHRNVFIIFFYSKFLFRHPNYLIRSHNHDSSVQSVHNLYILLYSQGRTVTPHHRDNNDV